MYGRFEETYARLSGKSVHWVLCTGNVGVWPDPIRADRPSRAAGVGDFLDYLVGKNRIPIPTLMVGGSHDDHVWIKRMVANGDGELIENLHYLVNGNKTFIENQDISVTVLGMGGTYSPNPKLGNYTQKDIGRGALAGPIDLMLTHEAPDGEQFGSHTSVAKGLNKLCFATQPKLLIHGKYAETKHYFTKQTNTRAVCVGNRGYQIFDITKNSIVKIETS